MATTIQTAKERNARKGEEQIIPLSKARIRTSHIPVVADVRLGKFEEDKFRAGFHRNPGAGKTRSIHFTLLGGKKVSPLYQL
jgi:hypothetical protein